MCPYDRDQFLGLHLNHRITTVPTGGVWTQLFPQNNSRHKAVLPAVQNNATKYAFAQTTPVTEQFIINNPSTFLILSLDDIGDLLYLPLWGLNSGTYAPQAIDIFWKMP